MKTNLRALRKAAKMTQEELAEAAGMCQTTLSKYERGEMGMSLRAAMALTEVLGVSLNQLIGDLSLRDKLEITARAETKTTENFRRFAEEQRQSVP